MYKSKVYSTCKVDSTKTKRNEKNTLLQQWSSLFAEAQLAKLENKTTKTQQYETNEKPIQTIAKCSDTHIPITYDSL